MASVNKVIIVGNLGRDPEVRYMPNSEAVANIAVATTEAASSASSHRATAVATGPESLMPALVAFRIMAAAWSVAEVFPMDR